MKLKFVGGAGHVTGSCHWLVHEKTGLQLLVDCGLTQGGLWDINNQPPFPFSPARINAVLLTHAHLDHCGRIPELFSKGFTGRIFCTTPTAELVKENLLDLEFQKECQKRGIPLRLRRFHRAGAEASAKSAPAENGQDGEKEKGEDKPFQRKGKGRKAWDAIKPLEERLDQAFECRDMHPKFGWGRQVMIDDDVSIGFLRSSHLLGAFGVMVSWVNGADRYGRVARKSVCFSGDIGTVLDAGGDASDVNFHPLLKRTQVPHESTDYIVMESTYGTDLREERHKRFQDRIDALRRIMSRADSGTVVIPAFAMGRTQDILFDVMYLAKQGLLGSKCTIHLDSPSGQRATKTYLDALLKRHGAGYRYRNDEVTRRFFMSEAEAEASRAREKQGQEEDNSSHKATDNFLREMRKALFPVAATGAGEEESADKPGRTYSESNFSVVFSKSREIPQTPAEGEKQIIITSGGMFQGGPVIGHLRRLEEGSAVFVISGYQTLPLGKYLREVAALHDSDEGDENDLLRYFSLDAEVAKATKIQSLETNQIKGRVFDISAYYSGHADREGLMRYLFKSKRPAPESPHNATVFLNHGESWKRYALRKFILDREPEPNDYRRVSGVEVPYMDSPFFDMDAGEWEEESAENIAKEIAKALPLVKRYIT